MLEDLFHQLANAAVGFQLGAEVEGFGIGVGIWSGVLACGKFFSQQQIATQWFEHVRPRARRLRIAHLDWFASSQGTDGIRHDPLSRSVATDNHIAGPGCGDTQLRGLAGPVSAAGSR